MVEQRAFNSVAVSSNLTGPNIYYSFLAQWLERLTVNQQVAGSNPAKGALALGANPWGVQLSGRVDHSK